MVFSLHLGLFIPLLRESANGAREQSRSRLFPGEDVRAGGPDARSPRCRWGGGRLRTGSPDPGGPAHEGHAEARGVEVTEQRKGQSRTGCEHQLAPWGVT